jgi:hypothetical protein
LSSLKFVFRIQPADVVLLVIDSAQSPLFNRPASISIHGLIIDAMNSSRLFDALKPCLVVARISKRILHQSTL